MSWIKIFLVMTFLIFQVKFFILLPEIKDLGVDILFFIFVYQVLVILSGVLIWKGKILILANTLALLLFLNLFITVPKAINDYITLAPNTFTKVEILGNTINGFIGINTISTDQKGFRSIREIDYQSDRYLRIFAIGGSTTEEIYSDDTETWTALLQDKLEVHIESPVEVINTGVSGIRAKHHLATLINTEEFHPDYYIFLVGVNDWNHQISKKKNVDMITSSIRDTILYKILKFLKPLPKIDRETVQQNYGEYYSSQNDSLSRSDVRSISINQVDEDYMNVMNKIAIRCNTGNYQCIFVSQPSAYSYEITENLKSKLWMTPPNALYTFDLESLIQISSFYNSWLKNLAKVNNIAFCDLASQIEPSERFFFDDVHFNENGSNRVANVLFSCLRDKLINKST